MVPAAFTTTWCANMTLADLLEFSDAFAAGLSAADGVVWAAASLFTLIAAITVSSAVGSLPKAVLFAPVIMAVSLAAPYLSMQYHIALVPDRHGQQIAASLLGAFAGLCVMTVATLVVAAIASRVKPVTNGYTGVST